jgi:hypothetical protein
VARIAELETALSRLRKREEWLVEALREIAYQPAPGLGRLVGYRHPEEIARAALARHA